MVFETASIIQEIAGRSGRGHDGRGQCMQGILRPERVKFVSQRRSRHRAFFWRGVIHIGEEGKAEQFCCVQRGAFAASEKLSIQPIVCFQIHFEFLSPKLGREKVAN